jgi:hypothetical protein
MAQGRVILRTHYGCPRNIGFRDMRTGTLHAGSMVAERDGSDMIEEPSARTDLKVMGITPGSFTFTTTADRERRLQVDTGTYGPFANSSGGDAITVADIDTICYAVDGNTVSKTDKTGTLSPAGYVRYVFDNGGVVVDFSFYETIATMRQGAIL